MPASGGMIDEAAVLTTPDGRVFHGVSYRGDRAAFRAKPVERCAGRGLAWAWVDAEALRRSDGTSFRLADCGVVLG